ncbi:MAG: transglutaminase family protein [Hyphomicrobiaceae bacterium]|nr:transglutaminase family protein [Hyphomicrobiaceae bacterium]MCC0025233.1 transglutaminase family protein [Hyphomicrobiaceae bacterium]
MLLSVTHSTEYCYDEPISYGLQRLRQTAKARPGQIVRNWTTELEGATSQVSYTDHFGNFTELVSVISGADKIVVRAKGEVETEDISGVIGKHRGYTPLWLFQRHTDLTRPSDAIKTLAHEASGDDDIARLHDLMGRLADAIKYESGTTHALTTAAEALEHGVGVCQDHAHVFCSAARELGYPARYISGLLRMDDTDLQAASHAWAEVHVDALGWVGFDVSNKVSPDERYVCVATGLDYSDAAPILGIRHGTANESLSVAVVVEQ